MNEHYNSKLVKKTLQKSLRIINSCNSDYRLLGSVVTASILGQQHRDLGDLDFIADTRHRECILSSLYKLGYRPRKGMFSFARRYLSMDSLEHPSLLEIGFFWGKFQQDGSFLMGTHRNGGLIDSTAIKKQNYTLHGVEFIGLPEQVITRGVATSSHNPKRKKELLLISEKHIQPQPNGYIHVFIYGFQVDWLYSLSMSFLNVLGGARVKLGLPFDPWR